MLNSFDVMRFVWTSVFTFLQRWILFGHYLWCNLSQNKSSKGAVEKSGISEKTDKLQIMLE